MFRIIPEQDGERFAVVHFEFTQDVIDRETKHYRELGILEEIQGLEPGTYVKLVDKVEGKVVMSDTWMEQHSNAPAVQRAAGHVLVGGLGIGLIVVPLLEKDDVRRVTIIEKHREVIDLVLPHLKVCLGKEGAEAERLEVIHGDVFTYTPSADVVFDTIYLDIWNDIDPGNRHEIRMLQARYAKHLRDPAEGWIGSWREEDVE